MRVSRKLENWHQNCGNWHQIFISSKEFRRKTEKKFAQKLHEKLFVWMDCMRVVKKMSLNEADLRTDIHPILYNLLNFA